MVLAVTLHNIPEGMAVGVVFAGAMMENSTVSMAGAIALAIGIAIRKFPGRRNHFDAIKITGNVKIKRPFFVWRDVWCCGTDFGCDYDSVS